MATTLEQHLDSFARSRCGRGEMVEVIGAIAAAAKAVAALIAMGDLEGSLATEVRGQCRTGGDVPRALDIQADALFHAALRQAPVGVLGSEEHSGPRLMEHGAPLAVVLDPLDGSSNIDTNISVGSIFSILPIGRLAPADALLQAGRRQLAAGFVVYGPQTAMVLTLGHGTDVFILEPDSRTFVMIKQGIRIPVEGSDYAINASNYRHWHPPVRSYIDDCLAGAEGPRGKDFNMRWIASLVAEAYRILMRGGIFLYPADQRRGYSQGRLRLTYEASPLAMVIEQAGGAATNGEAAILDLVPTDLHQRVPLVFGSKSKVERVTRYHADPASMSEKSPLFGRRGLFQLS